MREDIIKPQERNAPMLQIIRHQSPLNSQLSTGNPLFAIRHTLFVPLRFYETNTLPSASPLFLIPGFHPSTFTVRDSPFLPRNFFGLLFRLILSIMGTNGGLS